MLPIGFVIVVMVYVEQTIRSPGANEPLSAYAIYFSLIGTFTAWPTYVITRSLPDFEVDGVSIIVLSVFFPVWGIIGVVVGLGVFAPFTCTALWSLNLSLVLRGRRAWHFFVIQSFAMLVIGSVVVALASKYLVDSFVLPSTLAWHLAHPFALRLAAELRRRDLEHLRGVCPHCGYPREGLTPGTPCPECGLGG
jgi:hypothetical protein